MIGDQYALFPVMFAECDICGASDGTLDDLVSIYTRGRITAHPECGARRGYYPEAEHTSPARPDTGQARGAQDRVNGRRSRSRRDAAGAVEAGRSAANDEPVEGRDGPSPLAPAHPSRSAR